MPSYQGQNKSETAMEPFPPFQFPPIPLNTRSETPDQQAAPTSSVSPPPIPKSRRNDAGGGTRRGSHVTLGNTGISKRSTPGPSKSGSGRASGIAIINHNNNTATATATITTTTTRSHHNQQQTDIIPITPGMTPQQRNSAIEHNRQVESWMDDRARNNMSAKRSRLKKMMYIVDMDNTIKSYEANNREYQVAYSTLRSILARHNLLGELGPTFKDPKPFIRPEVLRGQVNDVAEHRAKLEKEATKQDLNDLGLAFAEKVRALVNKTGPANNEDAMARVLEENRLKAEECDRKAAQYEVQLHEHERKAEECKAKVVDMKKQRDDYRSASLKYEGMAIARQEEENRMEVDKVAHSRRGSFVGRELPGIPEEGPFIVDETQTVQPHPVWIASTQAGIPSTQTQQQQIQTQAPPEPLKVSPQSTQPVPIPRNDNPESPQDFSNKGKAEPESQSPEAIPRTNQYAEDNQDFLNELEAWRRSSVDQSELLGDGYDGLPGMDVQFELGPDGELTFYDATVGIDSGPGAQQQQIAPEGSRGADEFRPTTHTGTSTALKSSPGFGFAALPSTTTTTAATAAQKQAVFSEASFNPEPVGYTNNAWLRNHNQNQTSRFFSSPAPAPSVLPSMRAGNEQQQQQQQRGRSQQQQQGVGSENPGRDHLQSGQNGFGNGQQQGGSSSNDGQQMFGKGSSGP